MCGATNIIKCWADFDLFQTVILTILSSAALPSLLGSIALMSLEEASEYRGLGLDQ